MFQGVRADRGWTVVGRTQMRRSRGVPMATRRGCPERWCSRGEAWLLVGSPATGGRWRRKDGPGATGDDADPPALALAGEVALDIDGGARCKVADVGKVDAAEDDPVTVDPLAERISLGEQDETEVAGGADGSGPAADQADQADPIHRFSASASMASWSPAVAASAKAVASAAWPSSTWWPLERHSL